MRRHVLPALVLSLGLLGTVSPLAGGGAASAEVPGLSHTATACEADTDSMARLYRAAFDRDAEVDGFDFWADQYVFGTWNYLDIARQFVHSPEFRDKYGELDDAALVRQLYRNVLGREGDAEGIAFWEAEMQRWRAGEVDHNGTLVVDPQARLLARFSESPENIERTGTTQPALGPFNEGRAEVTFGCGLAPVAALPDAGDLVGEWELHRFGLSSLFFGDIACSGAFDPAPEPVSQLLSRFGETGLASASVDVVIYSFTTERGAERRLDRLEQRLADECLYSTDDEDELIAISTPSVGDRAIAVRIGSPSEFTPAAALIHAVMVRVDHHLVIVEVTVGPGGDPAALLEEVVTVVTTKLEALPAD